MDLAGVYYDPTNPSGFSGAQSLVSSVKTFHTGDVVKEWLKKQDAYTIHKPVTKHFTRNRYIVNNIFELWQADLCDMRNISQYNDGVNYILTVIDVFSKVAWVKTLKLKTGASVINAFKEIFAECGATPVNVQTDKGKEFIAAPVKKFFKDREINFFVTNNPDVKASVIERFNRTLKVRMFRYFTYANSYRYVDVLNDLIESYNNRYHSSIKMAPKNVNEQNILQVWNNLYRKGVGPRKTPKLKLHQHVRISRTKHVFEKGYENNWSQEVFKIATVINRRPPVYRLVDLNGEEIEGTFYEQELQPVILQDDTVFKIEKILDKKGRGANKKFLVKWLGYSDKFNSWVAAADLKQI